MNRHHQSRKSSSSIAPKLEQGVNATQMSTPPQPVSVLSPKSRPTPPSHANSPPGSGQPFGGPPALSPPVSDSMSLRTSAQAPAAKNHPLSPVPASPSTSRPNSAVPHPGTAQSAARAAPVTTASPSTVSSAAGYYPTPAFQNHMEQLGRFKSRVCFSNALLLTAEQSKSMMRKAR